MLTKITFNPYGMKNKVHYLIPEATITQVQDKLAEVENLLKPYLVELTPSERHDLPKMSDGTQPFVCKCLEYCDSYPEYAPPFMDKAELAADMKVWEQLIPILRTIKKMAVALDDTVMEAGSENYSNAFAYYNSVKSAARMNMPCAKVIYDDLQKRFVKSVSAKKAELN